MPGTLILTTACLAVFVGSPDAVVTKVITGHAGRHSFVLRIVAGPFRRSRHHLRVVLNKDKEVAPTYWMDGKPEYPPGDSMSKNWYGTDGGFPSTEFYSISVKVDGRPWRFPKRLWQDCYDEGISADPKDKNPSGRLSEDGKRLAINFGGSDAAGSYWVRWHLRKDGRATREMHWADVEH